MRGRTRRKMIANDEGAIRAWFEDRAYRINNHIDVMLFRFEEELRGTTIPDDVEEVKAVLAGVLDQAVIEIIKSRESKADDSGEKEG